MAASQVLQRPVTYNLCDCRQNWRLLFAINVYFLLWKMVAVIYNKPELAYVSYKKQLPLNSADTSCK